VDRSDPGGSGLNMVQVKTFHTTDGKTFTNESEAREYQLRLDIEKRLCDYPIYGNENEPDHSVDGEDLIDWIRHNQDIVRDLIR